MLQNIPRYHIKLLPARHTDSETLSEIIDLVDSLYNSPLAPLKGTLSFDTGCRAVRGGGLDFELEQVVRSEQI